MNRTKSAQDSERQDRAGEPSLEVAPREVLWGGNVYLRGRRFPDCVFALEFGHEPLPIGDVLLGRLAARGVRPDGQGRFIAVLPTRAMRLGECRITASHDRHGTVVSNAFEVQERVRTRGDGALAEGAYWRAHAFFEQRFGCLGYVPSGLRNHVVAAIRRLRNAPGYTAEIGGSGTSGLPEPGPPVVDVCNWTPIGPGPVMRSPSPGTSLIHAAGRTLAIAIHPTAPSTVLIGAAAGGIWKTTDGGENWTPTGDFQMSLAIGALAFDPTAPSRVLAGTGEYHQGTDGLLNYYGNGILRSVDSGETWTEYGTATFARQEVTRIVFDPTDPSGNRVFLSASNGVFASSDNGQSWTQLYASSASDLVAIPLPGPGEKLKLIAAVYAAGLWTSTRDGGSWGAWTQIVDDLFPATMKRIALAQVANDKKTVFVMFTNASFSRLVKTINGGGNWSEVTVRLNTSVDGGTDTVAGHWHSFTVPAADMVAAPAAHTYTTSSSGSPAHTHTVSFTQDQMIALAAGKAVMVTTSIAQGHTHTAVAGTTRSTDYNLVLAVHPSDANTLFLGEVHLWRSTSGGGTFDRVTDGEPTGLGIHVDQHAFAFDPASPDTTVWACNDGGIYRSLNLGGSWQHRNRGMQTLQYLALASHPQYEAVMLGGTQDNGAHRYEGHPAWRYVDGGDAGSCAIDPSLPARMYYSGTNLNLYRSDSAGSPGSWTPKNSGISGDSQFYPPFILDPSTPSVCYFGGGQLFRSPSIGDSWSPITNQLSGTITAVAVHPADSNIIFVGTSEGHVYRVQRTGASWNLADVTNDDLTAAPLPAGVSISDIAADTLGNVYVTVASVMISEATGEFSSDHVFRRASGSGAWEPRVGGLVQGNPVNCILIDPVLESRLFIGADLGVFKSENSGISWELWDQGLPNVPVFDLQLQPSKRLLRAATHGRGGWERKLDSSTCPLVDLYVRDNIIDTGRVIPSPEGLPHPFEAATVRHWQSPDIKVDASDPGYQTPSTINDYVAFQSDLTHETARRSVNNRFYAQVHNRGPNSANNVKARAFFASGAAGLPPLPSDFWSAATGKPWLGSVSGDWNDVGPTRELGRIEPAEAAIASWEWVIPPTASKHSCLLVLTSCDEDTIATGELDPDQLVLNSKHVALLNLQVLNPGEMASSAIMLELWSPTPEGGRSELVFAWGTLPDQTQVAVVFEKLPNLDAAANASPTELAKQGIELTAPKDEPFPGSYEADCRDPVKLDTDHVYRLKRGETAETTIPGVFVPGERPLIVAMHVMMRTDAAEEARFDIIQRRGTRTVGGCTYVIRGRRSGTPKNK